MIFYFFTHKLQPTPQIFMSLPHCMSRGLSMKFEKLSTSPWQDERAYIRSAEYILLEFID